MDKFKSKVAPSEITSERIYLNRRQVLVSLLTLPALSVVNDKASAQGELESVSNPNHTLQKRGYKELTPENKVLSYTNFYELGPSKEQPIANAHLYQSRPWTVKVSGEVRNPAEFDVDDLIALAPLEERVYRLRCVEAWSMVIPWLGYSFSHLIKKVEPTQDARFVEFVTFNPEELFPNKVNDSLTWPYVEGLRIDESMNSLTLLTFGMYGKALSNQNGAPVRIIIPWKYGFKSGKALVEIKFTKTLPATTWNVIQPSEYGFYANVNPNVNHPRWSQKSERAISDSFLPSRRKTELFNGYADSVAHLYKDMDLSQFY